MRHTVGSLIQSAENLHNWVEIHPDVSLLSVWVQNNRVRSVFFSNCIQPSLYPGSFVCVFCSLHSSVWCSPRWRCFLCFGFVSVQAHPEVEFSSWHNPPLLLLLLFFWFFFNTHMLCVYHFSGCIFWLLKGLSNKALILRNVWDYGTVTFRVFYAIAECVQAKWDERSSIIVALQ